MNSPGSYGRWTCRRACPAWTVEQSRCHCQPQLTLNRETGQLINHDLVQFASVPDSIYALGKAHMRSTTHENFPDVAFKIVPSFVWMTRTHTRAFKEDRRALLFHSYVPLLQAIEDVMHYFVCPQAVSQVPQHFRSFEMQASSDDCFAL